MRAGGNVGSSLLKYRYGVVTYGRRDHNQVPLALHEVGALDRVFTDFYAPHWLVALADRVAPPLARLLRRRHHPALSARHFSGDPIQQQLFFRYLGWRGLTPAQRYQIMEYEISKRAARYLIHHPDVGLVCYSYYWRAVAEARAAGQWAGPAVVFQVHPVASHIKRVIAEDRALTGLSYLPEPEEMAAPETDQQYLDSLAYADGVIVASSFTRRGLVEGGVPESKVRVVPYGFGFDQVPVTPQTAEKRWDAQRPLRLLWVGQLAYRKGPHHLFEAVRRFPAEQVQVSVVSRTPVPSELAARMPPNVSVFNSVSDEERQMMYKTHHLFVLPSLVEGFGLVYVEALAEGLPILATTNTGAPDVITPGIEGFVVAPSVPDAIVQVIEQCLADRDLLPAMSAAASTAAKKWSWALFRQGIRKNLASFESARDLCYEDWSSDGSHAH
jgi:glycosyltransferase involved in cell wall biosynthesis